MTNPKISVITAVYNAEKYLNESIDSILVQTFKDFEYIIVNDASTDSSLDIIKMYQKTDKRIKIINNDKNIGPAASRNKGLKVAKGEYIAIFDADDISLPERFQQQINFLKNKNNIFLCGTGVESIDENGNIINNSPTPIKSHQEIEKMLPKKNCIVHSSIMFRNEGFFYREKFVYAHDYDFYLVLLTNGLKIDNLETVLVKYRNITNNITYSKKHKQNLFASKAKEYCKQRQKTGRDEYTSFNPSKIMNIEDKSPEKNLLQFKMGLCLENRDYDKAKNILSEYRKKNKGSILDTIPYLVVVTCPQLYKIYRKIRFGERI